MGHGSDIKWPGVPAGLKYVEVRLPGTFRELVANLSLSDDEIGKIVRCLLLDTDIGLNAKIEAEVLYYREYLVKKNNTRLRVEALRRRRKAAKAGALSEASKPSVAENKVVTVTLGEEDECGDSLSNEKTPTIIIEKTPPIVPLEKNPSSSLEKSGVVAAAGRTKTKREKLAEGIQNDLFSAALGSAAGGLRPESPESAPGGSPVASEASGGTNHNQDIGRAPRAILDDADTRQDGAWILGRFAMFWAKYPKKVAKADASKAFTKLIKKQPNVEKFMETLMASLNWWINQPQWKKDNGTFIPNAATWLNRGCWEDIKENAASGGAQFLRGSDESDEELIRRMQGG